MNRGSLNYTLIMGAALLFSLSISFIFPTKTLARDLEVKGVAWSPNIGWIIMNCDDDMGNNTCANVPYGVKIVEDKYADATLKGYAWSPNIGWISFNADDVQGCPEPSPIYCAPKVNRSTGEVRGFARALAGDPDPLDPNGLDWSGWIRLSGGPSGKYPSLPPTPTNQCATLAGGWFGGKCGVYFDPITGYFRGYAWGGPVVGVIGFNAGPLTVGGPGLIDARPFDFTVSTDPEFWRLGGNGRGTSTITVMPTQGIPSPVALSATSTKGSGITTLIGMGSGAGFYVPAICTRFPCDATLPKPPRVGIRQPATIVMSPATVTVTGSATVAGRVIRRSAYIQVLRSSAAGVNLYFINDQNASTTNLTVYQGKPAIPYWQNSNVDNCRTGGTLDQWNKYEFPQGTSTLRGSSVLTGSYNGIDTKSLKGDYTLTLNCSDSTIPDSPEIIDTIYLRVLSNLVEGGGSGGKYTEF